MSGADDDYEIRRQPPRYRAYQRIIPLQAHHIEQYQEAEHHHKQQIGGRRQAKTVHTVEPSEKPVRRIIGRYLEGRHTAKQGICPQGLLAGGIIIHLSLMAVGRTLLHIRLTQRIALKIIGIEKSNRHQRYHGYRHKEAPHLWALNPLVEFVHTIKFFFRLQR